ncbi:hypothetical protein M5K25_007411 [Dendrobium thyrsiflorum]|uniref:glycerophosphodiester phosphodiesterase n=1 Tax=Dendrobium thyrsiflorum TaxID=117978 RepID=A0ABD0VDU7_DENTH
MYAGRSISTIQNFYGGLLISPYFAPLFNDRLAPRTQLSGKIPILFISSRYTDSSEGAMALKAVPVIEIPIIDQVPEPLSIALSSPRLSELAITAETSKPASFAVIGHRGNGMNLPSSAAMRENSILSFNEASRFRIPFIEFDVQVTRDGVPVVFHDVFILTRESGVVSEHRVTDLSLEEFLSYGSQREPDQTGKPLLRRATNGRVFDWVVENDDRLCTLEEAFHCVDPRLGFNIELKFDDDFVYREEELDTALQIILRSVAANASGRQVIFSSFHPDAARIVKRMQGDCPVYFLTDGSSRTKHDDARRNSLEAAVKLCVESGLEGIVSEVRAVLRDPTAVAGIKERNLRLLTYGQLNNTVEIVYMQHMMGIDGVIVDRVQEISEAASGFVALQERGREGERRKEVGAKFPEGQLSYLRNLIAEMVRS